MSLAAPSTSYSSSLFFVAFAAAGFSTSGLGSKICSLQLRPPSWLARIVP
jgi:hypothetical protein